MVKKVHYILDMNLSTDVYNITNTKTGQNLQIKNTYILSFF